MKGYSTEGGNYIPKRQRDRQPV